MMSAGTDAIAHGRPRQVSDVNLLRDELVAAAEQHKLLLRHFPFISAPQPVAQELAFSRLANDPSYVLCYFFFHSLSVSLPQFPLLSNSLSTAVQFFFCSRVCILSGLISI